MSRIPISLELRFLRIPTIWTRHKGVFHDERGEHTEYFFAPEVRQDVERRFVIEDDPWKLRNEFLRMKHTEEAALQFLEHVGVWNAVSGQEPQGNLPKTALSGAFGFRLFHGSARPVSLEELWDEQESWNDKLKNPAKLRAEFRPPPNDNDIPHEHISFAFDTHFANTLPTHLEWKRSPQAVIQPITGRELLIATAWIDLVSGSEFQVCQNCGIPFTWPRKRMFCPPDEWGRPSPCAHVVAQRMYRKRKSEEKHQRGRNRRKRRIK
jgi:hypothetical protein